MATATTKKSPTDFLSTLLDDAKELLEDVLDNAKDLEKSARDGITDVRKVVLPTEADIKVLRNRVKDVSKQVEKLAKIRAGK